ncbi:MAG: LLM class F420-dependent oxidoreductase [Streptosporangiales bacterium]
MTTSIGRVGLWVTSRHLDMSEPEHHEAVAEIGELGYGALWFGNAPGDLALVTDALAASSGPGGDSGGGGDGLVIATGIVNIWMTAPADLAAAYRRVSERYPDRLLLGLGNSHAPPVEQTGQTYAKPYSKLVAYLDELDGLDTPVPHQDLALAALGPRTVALAGERTAGAHPYLTTPEHTQHAREILGQGPLLAPEQKVVLEEEPATARGIARQTLTRYLEMPNYLNNLRRLGFADTDFPGGGSDRLVDALVAWGDLAAIKDRVQAHHDAGADHVCVQVLSGSTALPRVQWRQLAEALLP